MPAPLPIVAAEEVRQAAGRRAAEVGLGRVRRVPGDQLVHRLRRMVGVDRERELEVGDLRDRREIHQRVVRRLREHHRREHGDDDRRQHQDASIGRRVLHRLGDDPSAGAGPVLDHDRLLQLVLHAVGDQPRGDVGRAAGGEADEQPHRLVDLGERGSRGERQGGRAGKCEGELWQGTHMAVRSPRG